VKVIGVDGYRTVAAGFPDRTIVKWEATRTWFNENMCLGEGVDASGEPCLVYGPAWNVEYEIRASTQPVPEGLPLPTHLDNYRAFAILSEAAPVDGRTKDGPSVEGARQAEPVVIPFRTYSARMIVPAKDMKRSIVLSVADAMADLLIHVATHGVTRRPEGLSGNVIPAVSPT